MLYNFNIFKSHTIYWLTRCIKSPVICRFTPKESNYVIPHSGHNSLIASHKRWNRPHNNERFTLHAFNTVKILTFPFIGYVKKILSAKAHSLDNMTNIFKGSIYYSLRCIHGFTCLNANFCIDLLAEDQFMFMLFQVKKFVRISPGLG